jgi:rare lipoprotein A
VESLLPGQPAPAAAVTAAAAPAPLPAPVPAEAKGIYLQLGAFSSPQGAESLRERLGRELGWLSEAIKIVPGGALYRLHVGPYRSQDDARPVADRIYAELSLRPLIVSR